MTVHTQNDIWSDRPRTAIGDLRAIVAGSGPLVVLLHGVGLRAEAWNGQIDALNTSGFRVVAPDMPGHGTAATGPIETFASQIAECLRAPAILVGHSMGAMIALDLAARFPDRVRGVAALNAIHRRSPSAQASVQKRAADLDGVTCPDPSTTLERWFAAEQSTARAACARWLRSVDPGGYKAAYTIFAQSDGPTDASLTGLTCPALFMTGQDEPNSTPDMSKAMARLCPAGQAEVVEGAAHMMPMTHADRVNQTLIQFARGCAT